MEKRILTKHPQGKSGTNISLVKYETIRNAIVDALATNRELTFKQLVDDISAQLASGFDGSIPWYVTTIKLDLEAREVIQRIPNSRPQRLRLIQEPK